VVWMAAFLKCVDFKRAKNTTNPCISRGQKIQQIHATVGSQFAATAGALWREIFFKNHTLDREAQKLRGTLASRKAQAFGRAARRSGEEKVCFFPMVGKKNIYTTLHGWRKNPYGSFTICWFRCVCCLLYWVYCVWF
jgi:hypothetical protein